MNFPCSVWVSDVQWVTFVLQLLCPPLGDCLRLLLSCHLGATTAYELSLDSVLVTATRSLLHTGAIPTLRVLSIENEVYPRFWVCVGILSVGCSSSRCVWRKVELCDCWWQGDCSGTRKKKRKRNLKWCGIIKVLVLVPLQCMAFTNLNW